METLNSKGPETEPCGTPINILLYELSFSFIFTLFTLSI